MYLKRLYRQHKGWFFFVLLFIFAQLFINCKHGVVFSPFYHYGMYSSVIDKQKTYNFYEVKVNGKILQTQNFSPQEWDKIMLPLQMNDSQKAWNKNMYENTIKRLLHVKDSAVYENRNYTADEFSDWYKNYLETIIEIKIDSVNILHKSILF